MTQADTSQGIGQAQQAMGRGGEFVPTLKLGNGDRAVFWFLSGGYDNLFGGGKFHEYRQTDEQGNLLYFASIPCIASYREGEVCQFCDPARKGGPGNVRRYFSVWVYVDHILHLGDNPTEDGPRWGTVKLPKENNRTMFKEDVQDVILLQLSSGRKQARFRAVTSLVAEHGSLHTHKYQIRRSGTGIDTEYDITVAAAKPLPESLPIKGEAKALADVLAECTPVLELYDGQLTSGPPPNMAVSAEEAENFVPLGDDEGVAPFGTDTVEGDDEGYTP